jgi:cell division protein FtsB
MKGELGGGVAVSRIRDGDVDGARDCVATDRYGEEPRTQAGREPLDQLLNRRDLPDVRDFCTGEVAMDDIRRRSARVDESLDERHAPRDGGKERIRDGARRHDFLEEESLRQLVGHVTSLPEENPRIFPSRGHRTTFVRHPSMAESSLLRGLPLAVLTVSLVTVPVLVLEPQGIPRMHSLEKELSGVRVENAELRRDVAKLRTEVKDLREDPQAVERIAREQLGLVRKSEVVFQFDKR